MARIPGFAGPSNALQALNQDSERTINFYLEATAPGLGKDDIGLKSTPGLKIAISVPNSPLWEMFEQDGRAFFIAGTSFFELTYNDITDVYTATNYGVLSTITFPPTICSNGTAGGQLFITAGGDGFIFDLNTNALSAALAGGFPTGMARAGEFMDGYFLVLIENSRSFQISTLEDGTVWDILDVGERSEGSDNIVAMKRNHREIWFLGTKTTEVWYDNGDADFPFAPIQGVFIEQGCAGTGFTVVRLDNTIMWVGKDERGQGVVWRADGYTPKRVSTNAIERWIKLAGLSNDFVRAFGYQDEGHLFYVLNIPAQAQVERLSWVYDISLDAWHERAQWDSTHCIWIPYVLACHAFAFGKHLGGGNNLTGSGTIYEITLERFGEQRLT